MSEKVERPWGTYEVTDRGDGFLVKRVSVRPGGQLSLQYHRHRSEHWVVVRGAAWVTQGDKQFTLNANESTYIPAGTVHRIENRGAEALEIVEVQCGDPLIEEDIVRLEDRYGRETPRLADAFAAMQCEGLPARFVEEVRSIFADSAGVQDLVALWRDASDEEEREAVEWDLFGALYDRMPPVSRATLNATVRDLLQTYGVYGTAVCTDLPVSVVQKLQLRYEKTA